MIIYNDDDNDVTYIVESRQEGNKADDSAVEKHHTSSEQ